ncbi:MAG: hypothetical protein J7L39_04130 [Candidatus Aenigmarchaeota archaeon]|nr:hypothetical protein [Candidatus Aenigmarchaeota archaeon]
MQESKEREYELVPVTPLRKLEKRIEKIEASIGYFDSRELYKDIVDILRINQEIVAELVKSNEALRVEISKLPLKIETLVDKLDEFIELIKAAGEEEVSKIEEKSSKDLEKKLEELITINKKIAENYSSMLEYLSEIENRLRKLTVVRPIPKKLIPRKPTI